MLDSWVETMLILASEEDVLGKISKEEVIGKFAETGSDK